MIKTVKQVPSNYSLRSRDFQLIARVFDTVFNSSKLYSDMVKYNTVSKNTDMQLLDLISKTLGFDSKRKYDINDLYVLCSAFKSILQNKGTKKSIDDCIKVLLKSQNISKHFYVEDVVDENKKKTYELKIFIPYELTDIALLEDMLDYILPSGYLYSIITVLGNNPGGVETDVAGVTDSIDVHRYENSELGFVLPKTITLQEDKYKSELSVVYKKDEE